jgi:epoxyqueuosine reductase
VLDATRCISYYTIEVKGAIPEQFRPAIGRHVFGCDICQDVCPWNREGLVSLLPEFQPRALTPEAGSPPDAANAKPEESLAESSEALRTAFNPPLASLAGWNEEEFRAAFRNSPVRRARYRGFLRNVAVAMGNSGEKRFQPVLEQLAQSDDAVVQEHARWALDRLARAGDPGPKWISSDDGQAKAD